MRRGARAGQTRNSGHGTAQANTATFAALDGAGGHALGVQRVGTRAARRHAARRGSRGGSARGSPRRGRRDRGRARALPRLQPARRRSLGANARRGGDLARDRRRDHVPSHANSSPARRRRYELLSAWLPGRGGRQCARHRVRRRDGRRALPACSEASRCWSRCTWRSAARAGGSRRAAGRARALASCRRVGLVSVMMGLGGGTLGVPDADAVRCTDPSRGRDRRRSRIGDRDSGRARAHVGGDRSPRPAAGLHRLCERDRLRADRPRPPGSPRRSERASRTPSRRLPCGAASRSSCCSRRCACCWICAEATRPARGRGYQGARPSRHDFDRSPIDLDL